LKNFKKLINKNLSDKKGTRAKAPTAGRISFLDKTIKDKINVKTEKKKKKYEPTIKSIISNFNGKNKAGTTKSVSCSLFDTSFELKFDLNMEDFTYNTDDAIRNLRYLMWIGNDEKSVMCPGILLAQNKHLVVQMRTQMDGDSTLEYFYSKMPVMESNKIKLVCCYSNRTCDLYVNDIKTSYKINGQIVTPNKNEYVAQRIWIGRHFFMGGFGGNLSNLTVRLLDNAECGIKNTHNNFEGSFMVGASGVKHKDYNLVVRNEIKVISFDSNINTYTQDIRRHGSLPVHAHLRSKYSWSGSKKYKTYLQATFDRPYNVSYILTRGREGTNEYVTKYVMKYRDPFKNKWHIYPMYYQGSLTTNAISENKPRIFEGNKDDNSVKSNILGIITDSVRIYPKKWNIEPSLRLGFTGKPLKIENNCKYLKARMDNAVMENDRKIYKREYEKYCKKISAVNHNKLKKKYSKLKDAKKFAQSDLCNMQKEYAKQCKLVKGPVQTQLKPKVLCNTADKVLETLLNKQLEMNQGTKMVKKYNKQYAELAEKKGKKTIGKKTVVGKSSGKKNTKKNTRISTCRNINIDKQIYKNNKPF
jgi:hypothetical protein